MPVENQLIRASAGAGKTFQLTSRYIRLLAEGCPPERLVALTFARKAAAEFLQRILARLAKAATSQLNGGDGVAARELADEIGIEGDIDFGQHLAKLAAALPRLKLHTLDSFFVDVIHTYGNELGVEPNFEILDNFGTEMEAERRAIFAALMGDDPEAFLGHFTQVTHGWNDKAVFQNLLDFVADFQPIFLSIPEPEAWGNPDRIWPEGCPWANAVDPGDLDNAASDLLQRLDARRALKRPDDISDAAYGTWSKFVEEARRLTPGMRLDKGMSVFAKIRDAWDEVCNGSATLKLRSDRNYGAEECACMATLIRHVMHCQISVALERTRGIYGVLKAFEERYHAGVRSAGRLTFSDTARLLCGTRALSMAAGGDAANESELEATRLEIAFRLDGQLDHWMLDEFQDTSGDQWRAVSNLVSEAAADVPERSVFCVGDTKQAIYNWRGGDWRSFDRLYKACGGSQAVREISLDKTWRCSEPVVDLVNAVFEDPSRFPTDLREIAKPWSDTFSHYETEKSKLPGYATYHQPIRPNAAVQEFENDDDYAHRTAFAHLRSVDPIQRGLTCAVLVREWKTAGQFVNFVREHDPEGQLPIVLGGGRKGAGSDSALVGTMSAMLRAAAHPCHSVRDGRELPGHDWASIAMTPLAGALEKAGVDRASLPEWLLDRIHCDGIEAALRHCLDLLEASLEQPLDPFNLQRMDEFLHAAADYDATGRRDIDGFLDFAEQLRVPQAAAGEAIQVMTIHAAKGLEFDMVIVLQLETDSLDTLGRSSGLGVRKEDDENLLLSSRGQDSATSWVLQLPPKDYTLLDPTLCALREEAQAERTFENLCLLYVALTRAIHATYVVTKEPTTNTNSPARFLTKTLAPAGEGETETNADEVELADGIPAKRLYDSGDPAWYLKVEEEDPDSADEPAPDNEFPPPSPSPSPIAAGPAITPSSAVAQSGAPPADGKPDADLEKQLPFPVLTAMRRSQEHGDLAHQLFEQIEWLDAFGDESAAITAHWESLLGPITTDERTTAEAEVLACLDSPEVTSLLTRPTDPDTTTEVWREKAFDTTLRLDGDESPRWVSGIFDRVHIVRGKTEATIRSATIIDFKSNRVSGDDEVTSKATSYAPQMKLYREVLAQLLGIEAGAIDTALIFTKPGKVVSDEPDPSAGSAAVGTGAPIALGFPLALYADVIESSTGTRPQTWIHLVSGGRPSASRQTS